MFCWLHDDYSKGDPKCYASGFSRWCIEPSAKGFGRSEGDQIQIQDANGSIDSCTQSNPKVEDIIN